MEIIKIENKSNRKSNRL